MIEGLQGTVNKIGVTVSRKLTDGNYGSFEVAYYIEASIADAQTDIDEQFEILDTYLTNKVGKSAHDKEQKIAKTPTLDEMLEKVTPENRHAEVRTTPVTQHAGMLESATETFEVETISVENRNGKNYFKAKGGKYKKFGVTVWPEVISSEPLEWAADDVAPGEHEAPHGLTAIVQMEDGKPKKVTGWA